MNKGKEALILILFSSFLFAQNYILKNIIFDEGGKKLTNANYILRFSLGQSAAGKGNNSSYTVRIGFWNFYYFGGPSVIAENLPKKIPTLRISSPTRTPFNLTCPAFDKTPVTLTIYNILGKKVYSEMNAKGTFTIKNLPAGTYLLRVEAKGYNVERKLIVVK
uniref:Carboxypeptidase regulatory-like domain-containing protein n=1 Tax=candidate division WOR-3 bacterium TaxID=2052148 RepID=A0A7C3UZN7_UNCW3